MADISPPEAILTALLLKAIDQDAAQKYLTNYQTFEAKRPSIEASNNGKWVAALNSEIVVADGRVELLDKIANEPDADRAYIEQIERTLR